MNNATPTTVSPKKGSTLAFWTITSLLAGIAAGLFFGELCSPLKIVGDAFVGLLRMTVLPYIIVALVANFGRLSVAESRRLALVGLSVLLVLWTVAMITLFMLAHSFPEWKQGSYFSTPMTTPGEKVDLISIFIPSNIFAALSDNHVPAVVLLCIWGGLALTGIENRQSLIAQLDVLAKMFMRISRSVANLTPLGVFAIAASTSGETTLEEFERLQTYIIIYVVGVTFLTFVALPLIVTFFTPFRYRDVVWVSRDAMITAFATGKLIIVLPMLIEKTEQLFADFDSRQTDKTVPAVDVLYPIAYPFPHVGKLLSMLFVPFAAWFLGNALSWHEYPSFMAAGIFSYFGGPNLAMPFLLDFMRLPRDMFQLFLLTGVIEGRLGDALGVMHLVTFSLVSTCALTGNLKVSWPTAIRYCLVIAVSTLCIQVALVSTLAPTLTVDEPSTNLLSQKQLIRQPIPSVRTPESSQNPAPLLPGESILERIRRRGIIRVGYNEDKLPFAYLNEHGNLVGLDVELAHAFARDLHVSIEFVRFDRDTLDKQLENDNFDVVMSGLVGTLERAERMQHTDSHMAATLSLVVEDYRVRKFQTLASVRDSADLRIGYVDLSEGFISRLRGSLPNAELISLKTSQQFFERKDRELDAFLVSAETGAAFTLLYPQFEVVIPKDLQVRLPLFYAIGNHDESMTDFLEHWIALRTEDGTFQTYYDYWILGKSELTDKPRWCIMRDVLHWVD